MKHNIITGKTNLDVRDNYRPLMMLRKRKQREYFTAFLFLAPWLIGLLVFTFWPFVNSFIISLHRSNLFSSTFIGLENYKNIFADWKFRKSLMATMKFVFISVPLRLAFALFIAVLLNKKLKGVNFFRSAMYLPSLIGGSVAIAAMWTQLFGPRGVINLFWLYGV